MSDEEVNFIYVASPNNMHYGQAKAALLHGKNVICEKPMCPRKAQVEELIALAKEKRYLYIEGGQNGLNSVRLVTKNSKTSYNLQDNSDRWFYEVQNMTKMLLEEDYHTIQKRLETTVNVIEVIETVRKKAGILFERE